MKSLTACKRQRLLPVFLLIFGLVTALLLVLPHRTLTQDELGNIDNIYMSTRTLNLNQAMADIAAGRPFIPQGDSSPAYYLFLAGIGILMGSPPAPYVLLAAQLSFAVILFTLYPLLFYRVSRSLFISLVSPLLLSWFCHDYLYTFRTDCYWATGWIVALALPVLTILYHRKWDVKDPALYAGLLLWFLAMGIADVFRPYASAGSLLITAALFLTKLVLPAVRSLKSAPLPAFLKNLWHSPLRRQGILVACLLLCWVFPQKIVPGVYSAVNGISQKSTSGGIWHAAYIGIGWEENPFGIQYDDLIAIEAAREVDPDVEWLTAEYSDIIRDQYLDLLRENPSYFLGSYRRKFILTLNSILFYQLPEATYWKYTAYYGALVGSLCTLFLLGSRKRLKTYAPLVACGILLFPFGMIQSMVAIIQLRYELGAILCLRMFWFCLVTAALHMIADFVKKRRRSRAVRP